MTTNLRRTRWGVFLLLLASYAFFWQARDWNTATRLMLTYALVDRGTLQLDGLENQTGDIAIFHGHYYLDKLPGFSYLATIPYALAKFTLGLPDHPLKTPEALALWDADYWVTLGTSGVATAFTAVLLVGLATDLGCRPRLALLVGLAYGLATPAYVYATLAYGHQLSALALLWSFILIRNRKPSANRLSWPMVGSGFLAAYASAIELQVGPVSAILGLDLVALCLLRKRPAKDLSAFIVGALVPTMGLLVYNQLAFGSPFEMGYFHHATKQFAQVHNQENPLGLLRPNWKLTGPLLVGMHRGLLFYAPILVLAFPGWIRMIGQRRWTDAWISGTVCAAVFLVNLSYPEWTGGWSTGPRLLLPLIPFAMIPIASLLAGNINEPERKRGPARSKVACLSPFPDDAKSVTSGALTIGRGGDRAKVSRPNETSLPPLGGGIEGGVSVVALCPETPPVAPLHEGGGRTLQSRNGFQSQALPTRSTDRGSHAWGLIAIALTAAGFVLNSMFLGVGGRIPHTILDPFREIVAPVWLGQPLPQGWPGDRFCRNLVSSRFGERLKALPLPWQAIQFLPLFVFQGIGVAALWRTLGRRTEMIADDAEGIADACATAPGNAPADAASDLAVDHQQDRRGGDENPGDPQAQPEGVLEDPRP